MSATPVKLTGTPIGTPGSYQNAGDTIAKAFDGDLTTAFDGPKGDGNWVGLDLGKTFVITQINYAPRPKWANRMTGGTFEVSSDPTFTNNRMVVLTVTADPPQGKLTTAMLPAPVSGRYVRFVSPHNGFGNVSEIEFWGVDPAGQVAVPVVIPVTPTPPATPVPAGLPGIVCGVGPTAGPVDTYAGMAPFNAHLDATKFTDLLTTRRDRGRWQLDAGYGQVPDPRHKADPIKYPNPMLDGDAALTSPSIGVAYDAPGDHFPRFVVTHPDGTQTTYVQHVHVSADARLPLFFAPASAGGNDANPGTDAAHPKVSLAEMNRLTFGKVQASNGLPWRVEILGDLPDAEKIGGGLGNLNPVAGTYFVGRPLPDGSRPTLRTAACPLFGLSAAGVVVRGLNITSRSPDAAGVGVAVYGATSPLIDNCTFGNLVAWLSIFGGEGSTEVRCVQVGPVKKQVRGVWGGKRHTTSLCDHGIGSDEEANDRIDGAGAGTGACFEATYVRQPRDRNQKANLDRRSTYGYVEAGCGIVDGQTGTSAPWSTKPGDPPICTQMLIAGNVRRMTGPMAMSEAISIHGYSNGVTVDGEDIVGPPGFADLSVVTQATPVDVVSVNAKVAGGMHVTPGFAPAGVTPVPVPTSPPVPVPSAAK